MTAGNFTVLVYTFLGAELIFWAVHAERFQGMFAIKKVPKLWGWQLPPILTAILKFPAQLIVASLEFKRIFNAESKLQYIP